MKHRIDITVVLILVFILSQVFGLFITSNYINISEKGDIGFEELPFNMERPDIEQNYTFLYIIFGVILGTILLLVLIKYKQSNLWKLWYGFAVILSLIVALTGFIDEKVALAIALTFGLWKIYRPNIIVHNLTEILIYGGIAAIFVPILNVFSAFMLLVLISIYDAYAVWKSKHMITMAKFQSDSKLFAGLSIPYSFKDLNKPIKIFNKNINKKEVKLGQSMKKTKVNSAILGGGDIAFPLIFSGVIMKDLIYSGLTKSLALSMTLIITFFVTISLIGLFVYGKKGRFYPAMPFISAGCFIGYFILILL